MNVVRPVTVLVVLLTVGLAVGCGGGRPATPLPEGDSEIAFTSRDSDWGYIYVLSSNGSKRRLVRIKATVDAVAWRPDGMALAWIDSPDLGRGNLPGVSDISIINTGRQRDADSDYVSRGRKSTVVVS